MFRWTILDSEHPTTSTEGEQALTLIKLPRWLTRDRKLMVHHFLPNVEERDFHDHPRSFWTFVLRGRYFDLVPCRRCAADRVGYAHPHCPRCFGRGVELGETMTAGIFRFRAATHRHITQAGREGAWTLVWMLPLERKWGFWHNGEFLPWRAYKKRFGFGMQCPTDEQREEAIGRWE
jgi:hypothetical protein